nr:MAG TPA: hypothetical protein [Caudoviricetes sp.]
MYSLGRISIPFYILYIIYKILFYFRGKPYIPYTER